MMTGVLGRLVLGRIHDDQPARNADLRRGKADAGRVIHGRQHVVHELAQRGIDALDGLGLLAQDGVRDGDDGDGWPCEPLT